MSSESVSERPNFQDVDDGLQEDVPPISTMAVASLVVGIFSLAAPFSIVLLPLCLLSIAIGAMSVFRISRDPGVGGLGLAQIGLGLGVMTAFWTVTATTTRQNNTYAVASEHAATFLEILSRGDLYEALELKQYEPQRQITGTNLKVYYESLTAEPREIYEEFKISHATKMVMQQGKNAKWEFVKGDSIQGDHRTRHIRVELRNVANTTSDSTVVVELQRKTGMLREDRTAPFWKVESLEIP